ncbi:hypothetical protein [Thauera sp. Sel9]|uniref:hypothetical protein n=1 Tax=Thauera sp. Sel9 TaxID=2974299 RepID=UPI0021E1A609|nr:hypothetical protein [Thauera sp. Sel9]MCV2218111.1 hypothetical protein [Thauera sp. Sel9]
MPATKAIDNDSAHQQASTIRWKGVVRHLHITPRTFLPMEAFDELTLITGRGIQGDHYMIDQESGFYSHKPEEGRQITLFEIETLEALARDAKIQLLPEEHRRNVTVQGVSLNHLVGRQLGRRSFTRSHATIYAMPSPRGDSRKTGFRFADQSG